MKKKYLVEFTHVSGEVEEVELITDNIEWSIEQWSRNRSVVGHKIINEGNSSTKQMLFS
jgi:hypothetical protein